MPTNPDFDEELLASLMTGYLRHAMARQQRLVDTGLPPIAEDSDHNRFLWIRLRYPGFFRHVAREIAIPKYQDRIQEIATAVTTEALGDATLEDWAKAMTGGRRDSSIARRQQRAVSHHLPDVLQSHPGTDPVDQRKKSFSTSFERIPGQQLPKEPLTPNLAQWKVAPSTKFRDLNDWLAVSGTLYATYPEQLEVWLAVAKAVRDSAKNLGKTKAAQTITDPMAVNVVANHAASICAEAWWMERSPSRQQELLTTPRVFDYVDSDAARAGKLWQELARLDGRWARLGGILLPTAALGLQRWNAAGQAGILLAAASQMQGLNEQQRATMLANAGYAFRVANRRDDSLRVYAQALDILDRSDETYLRVVTRVNLAEALGGPEGNRVASATLREARSIAGADHGCLVGFWLNCATMFRRLKNEEREEACFDGLLPYLGDRAELQANAHERMLELNRSRGLRRPMDPNDALAP